MAKKLKAIPPATKEVKLIPEDLKNQWGSCQATSMALALFDQAMFSPRHLQHVTPVAAFLSKLHEQTVEAALKHPQAHMITELNEILKSRKGVKDGQTKEA